MHKSSLKGYCPDKSVFWTGSLFFYIFIYFYYHFQFFSMTITEVCNPEKNICGHEGNPHLKITTLKILPYLARATSPADTCPRYSHFSLLSVMFCSINFQSSGKMWWIASKLSMLLASQLRIVLLKILSGSLFLLPFHELQIHLIHVKQCVTLLHHIASKPQAYLLHRTCSCIHWGVLLLTALVNKPLESLETIHGSFYVP